MRILLLAFLIAPLASMGAPLKGEALEKSLEGAWCNSDDGGKTCFGYDDFSKGSMNSCGSVPETGALVTLQTAYEVRGNRVCHTATAVNKGSLVNIGDIFCVDVLDISRRSMRYRLLSGEMITVYRAPKMKLSCPAEGAK